MENILKSKKIIIGEPQDTAFMKKNGIHQDGTTPMYRDIDGTLWAMSGHSHGGYIAMFKGTCLDDLEQLYPISTNFCVGHADFAFGGIRYPEGVKSRGSVWPFGLYICPNTHRFFCFFHNETGWAGKGTAYDSKGLCETPAFDSDFRHIGLMHSDDEGQNWTFDRWVLTAEQVCFTEKYNPNADCALGQKEGRICFGSGDFSLFVNPNDEYIYIIYNKVHANTFTERWENCDVYIARARKRTDGIMSDFVKYYSGSFCEAGNLGKESIIVKNSWHPRVVYHEKIKKYIMSSVLCNSDSNSFVTRQMQLRISENLIDWSEPINVTNENEKFGHHYVAIFPEDKINPISVLSNDRFSVLKNGNGTDVIRHSCEWEDLTD